MRVLIVDGDAGARAPLALELARAGHAVAEAAGIAQVTAAVAASPPDLVVLGLGRPDADGLAVLRRLRRDHPVLVVLLAARPSEEDVLGGFALGADDYIATPASPQIVAARVAAVLRRAAEGARREREARPRVGRLQVDPVAHEARVGGVPVCLTPLEARLLHLLAANAGRTVPYGRLLEYVWRGEPATRSNLKIRIHSLRRKLDDVAPDAVTIQAVVGAGYRLEARPEPPGGGTSGIPAGRPQRPA